MSSENQITPSTCDQCKFYTPPKFVQNPVADSALPKGRITSRTLKFGECGLTGAATQPGDPGCRQGVRK